MANELRRTHQGNRAVYAILQNAETGKAWNTSTDAFETFNADNLGDYAVDLASIGGDLIAADMPSNIPDCTLFITYYSKAIGATPTISDLTVDSGEYIWNGALSIATDTLSNSYASVADGDALMAIFLNSDPWDAASTAQKTKALRNATLIIDRLNFSGSKTTADQALEFPRNDSATIPTDIKYACILIANALLDGVNIENEYSNLRMTSQQYSTIKSSYASGSAPEHIAAGVPSFEAWGYIRPYLIDVSVIRTYRVS